MAFFALILIKVQLKQKSIMKTIMKNFGLIAMMLLVSLVLNAQPQPGDCVSDNQNFRSNKDKHVVNPQITPFTATDLASFNGLYYYPVDCQYVIEAKYKPTPAKMVDVPATDSSAIQLYDMGKVEVTVNGKKVSLQVYKNIDMPEFSSGTYFIPIKDGSTSSGATYANGRYVVINPPEQGGNFQLDFNMAVNPYENYNSNYNSLITTGGSILEAPLTVGERKYEDRIK
jgi:uncharacterized protein (DUF1684 family)